MVILKGRCVHVNCPSQGETDLVPILLLIVVQRIQVCDAGCLEELIVSVSVMGTMSAVSANTAHFICREAGES